MEAQTNEPEPTGRPWAGYILSGIPTLFLLFDAVLKLIKPEAVVQGTVELGYRESVIVPLGIMLAVRLVPLPLMTEFRAAARKREGRPVSRAGLLAVAAIWLAAVLGLTWLLWPSPSGA